jgi:two-component system, chemotaxis family, chemotaxis protein CheY
MKKVLVVDDSPTMRRMIISSLRGITPLQFEEAESGLAAVEKIALFRFDLVLLDLNMPDMHGMEVLQFLRAHVLYKSIPVVILTTRNDEETRAAAIDGGADIFMTKPFRPDDLAGNIRQILNRSNHEHQSEHIL